PGGRARRVLAPPVPRARARGRLPPVVRPGDAAGGGRPPTDRLAPGAPRPVGLLARRPARDPVGVLVVAGPDQPRGLVRPRHGAAGVRRPRAAARGAPRAAGVRD